MDKLAQEWHDAVDAYNSAVFLYAAGERPFEGMAAARTRLLSATRALIAEGWKRGYESDEQRAHAGTLEAWATELLPDRPTGEG